MYAPFLLVDVIHFISYKRAGCFEVNHFTKALQTTTTGSQELSLNLITQSPKMSHPTKPTLLCAAGVLVLLFVTSCLAAPVQKRQISSNQTETERDYYMRLRVGYHFAVSKYLCTVTTPCMRTLLV